MLLKFFPDYFNDIVWSNTGRIIDIIIKSSFINYLIRIVIRIPCKIGLTKDLKVYTDYKMWIRDKEVKTYINDLLFSNNSEYLKYYNNILAKYVNPHMKFGINFSENILRGVTVELYLKYINKF